MLAAFVRAQLSHETSWFMFGICRKKKSALVATPLSHRLSDRQKCDVHCHVCSRHVLGVHAGCLS